MAFFSWLDKEELLTDAALSVRAQVLNLNDQGNLYHPTFFPRANADSVRLADITSIADFRPVSDRREWNTRGRQITLKVPDMRQIEILPIESYFKIEEYEMQRLLEGSFGNADVIRRVIGPSIPDRTDRLVLANLRRMEIDAMSAWANGNVVVRNPQGSGANKTVSLSFAAGRYVTATPWTGGTGGTAWANFLTECYNAQVKIGSVRGAVMRLSTYRAIQQSAPLASSLGQTLPLSRAILEQRLAEELGASFTLITVEDTVSVYDDGGLTYTATKIWPANKIGFIPVGRPIGATYYAPVARAYSIASTNPGLQMQVNDMTVVKEVANGGRELTVECQINAFSMPNEQSIYVVDAGI